MGCVHVHCRFHILRVVAGWCGPRQWPAEPECDNSDSDNVPSGNQMVVNGGSCRGQLFTRVPAECGTFTM